MLDNEEKKFIRKALTCKLKYLRYMVYAMIFICFIFVGIPIFFKYFIRGEICQAFVQLIGLIYPITFFLGFYLFMEFITGSQIFKFIRGNYVVSREIIYAKYRNFYEVNSSMSGPGDYFYRTVYSDYCVTEKHARVNFVDEESYYNASIGNIGIVIQFGNNKNNIAIFVPPNKL